MYEFSPTRLYPTITTVRKDGEYLGAIQQRGPIHALNGDTPEHWAVVYPSDATGQFASKELAAEHLDKHRG